MNHPYYYFVQQKELIKARKPLFNLIQIFNNNLVDKKVNLYYQTNLDMYSSTYDSFMQSNIYTTIFNLNHPQTVRDFQQLIKSPLTDDTSLYKNLTRISADKVTKVISEKETERVLKNLQHVEKTLQQTKMDITKYNNAASKLSPTVSRQSILERCLTEGKMYNGRELSYKELNNLASDLEKYKKTRIDDQLWRDANENAVQNGLGPVKTHKVWIWSRLGKTRHSSMEGQTVKIDEMFEVVNDVTGASDKLRFPRDIENDSNGCSNICNCQCDVEYVNL